MSSSSCQFKVSIFGWVNKDKSVDGIKLKRIIDVPFSGNNDAASLVQDLVEEATKNVQACTVERAKIESSGDAENNVKKNNNNGDDDENSNKQEQKLESSPSTDATFLW